MRFFAISAISAGLTLLQLPAGAAETRAAGAVVRSKEWVVRRGEKREEEFVGDVRYDSAGASLRSDWALYRHAEKRWEAKGRVRLRKELAGGDAIEAEGERARFDEEGEHGVLEPAPGGRVRFKRAVAADGSFDEADGDRLRWESERSAVLSGRARGWGPRLAFQADEARWNGLERRLTLTGGRPVLHKIEGGWNTALKAENISATDSPRRIEASGGVKGWLFFKDRKTLKGLGK